MPYKVQSTTILPKEFVPIIKALKDIHSLHNKHQIWYLVGGSTAIVAASGKYFKVLGDVDIVCDIKQQEVLHNELIKLGYKLINIPPDSIVNRIKKHYVKDKQIIDIAFGSFTRKGYEIKLPMLIPGILLVFSKAMIRPSIYVLSNTKFLGFSKEAQWFGLGRFIDTIDAMNDKASKRKSNLSLLDENLNKKVIEEIKQGDPGIYIRSIPIVTPNNSTLLFLTNWFIKFWNRFF
ncbi:hypothetical protein A3A14_02765 [Candidatus Daviesbacteria bacterium RIFCSPLOWO2_01_FULL_43_38]|uniref:Uncharacterized protein n=2 Tax=Candidatus Daviesiibacteriota TaxID=1752718 RepID=A0A1F5K499_9BACT|nr:MAG: hypothetical protein UV41_C0006G0010 [Candidatus Daviesbacteria bacterium GW2011_GWA2_42_7]OGE19987.1 MAG: hypothetical protein A2874_00685 [Candidatus Daviesbacteria bacterium RIFCSPHIGHO2_01_FULL_43_17]OGE35737.1 MAG: hypothetical protein A3E45_00370 [Candidatus Daviesbacteria bacterium RIFCSPHIGHO2_12_FULL_43_11]OGE63425.1 MAG: hypothetical protein A3A14_02765 [Candidatus Daviesbacteria bacterium RIFCSPLOWO2_01_FULL_43_38]OGE69651.1 MAG: hypothetical protein A3J21_03070 [Candidatus D